MPILGVIASSKLVSTGSFESIATLTASGSPASLTFSSIPATYKTLQIRGISKDVNAGNASSVKLRFNGDTGSNYACFDATGDGSSVYGSAVSSQTSIPCGTAGTISSDVVFSGFYGANIMDFIDYASTSKYKTVKGITGSEGATYNPHKVSPFSGLWLSTAAISSITILAATTAIADGTVFSLYGIKG